MYLVMLTFSFMGLPIVLLQPDLAEGEEVINEHIMELQEELHKQVAMILIFLLIILYPSLKLFFTTDCVCARVCVCVCIDSNLGYHFYLSL